ncbi:MAG: hypothetical protein E7474_00115 [Ruminococcaceae bacterium]|nr:hypothetical protein [Oscillospiraceae bacterium]
MQLLEDGIIAALAAVGLITLLFLPVSALLRPRPRGTLDVLALVPCRAHDGAALEQTVRALLRARSDCGGFRRIVLLDRGMDEETRQIATLLCRDHCGVTLRDDNIFTMEETQ